MLSTCGQVALSTDAPLPPIFCHKGDWVKAALETFSARRDGKQATQSRLPYGRRRSWHVRRPSFTQCATSHNTFQSCSTIESVRLSETHDEMLVMELLGSSLQRVGDHHDEHASPRRAIGASSGTWHHPSIAVITHAWLGAQRYQTGEHLARSGGHIARARALPRRLWNGDSPATTGWMASPLTAQFHQLRLVSARACMQA